MFPAADDEPHRSKAPGQFLRGVDGRDHMRMQPRSARRGRHEHHDRPDKSVKHACSQGKADADAPACDERPISAHSGDGSLQVRAVTHNLVGDATPHKPITGYCTVTVGLVAARVNPPFRNNRNSYVPGVVGAAMVHDVLVTPAPTYVHCI